MDGLSAESRQRAKQLALSVVRAQNNRFIKELLRSKGVKPGTKKDDFEQQLLQAIDDDVLTFEEISAWLAAVEGWGNQHVYLFRPPPSLLSPADWTEAGCHARVAAAGLGPLWRADRVLEFPDKLKLCGIDFSDGALQFVWHAGSDTWLRVTDKDIPPRKEEDGDVYKYHAYRSTGVRALTRLEIRRDPPLAAVFLPEAWEEKRHQETLDSIRGEVDPVVSLRSFPSLSISDAIQALDARAMRAKTKKKTEPDDLRAHNTRLSTGRAWVEFGSSASYPDSLPILHVRRAVEPKEFTGTTGHFELVKTPKNELSRDIRIQMYGTHDRVRLWVMMTVKDVWTVLGIIHESCPPRD